MEKKKKKEKVGVLRPVNRYGERETETETERQRKRETDRQTQT